MQQQTYLPWYKKAALAFVLFCAMVILSESVARVAFYAIEGGNPYFLTFGFVPSTEYHSAESLGYTKFQPDTYMHQKAGGETISIQINGNGFRGKRSFVIADDEAVFRVATLGASSTFGYYVEDDETYPSQLEQMLKTSYPRHRIEVLNFGVPHARLSNIVALARHELPELRPDVISLYAGYNNATHPRDRGVTTKAYRFKDWLNFHSVFWRSVHSSVRNIYYSLVRTTNRDPAGIPNLSVPLRLDRQQVEQLREHARREFGSDLDELSRIATELSATLILITQRYDWEPQDNFDLESGWRSYEEQVDVMSRLYGEHGGLDAVDASFLIHSDLMNDLRRHAEERGTELVDGIAALGPNPSLMKSKVHLSPSGNRLIAEAIHRYVVSEDLVATRQANSPR